MKLKCLKGFNNIIFLYFNKKILALYYNLLLNFALRIKYTQIILNSMLHFYQKL